MTSWKSYLLILIVTSILLVACGGEEPAATPEPTPSPTPVSDLTRLPPQVRETLVELAARHQKITDEWEDFHSDFDRWREGLLECAATSFRVRLRQFASDFAEITQMSRSLPRASNVRAMADKLVQAAEEEEKALRVLRDKWQPDARELFEAVDLQRSAATVVQKEVEDGILDLAEQASSTSRALVEGFSRVSSGLNIDWDTFHRDYDDFRSKQGGLSFPETGAGLSELVAQFSRIVTQIRTLPTNELTRPVGQILVQAAEDEELALRKLRDAFVKTSEAAETAPPTRVAFEEFDAQVVNSNVRRREAAEKLADIVRDSSSLSEISIGEFSQSYDELLAVWKVFDQEYDTWLRSEGGCDRSKAIETLSQFSLRFSQLAKDVRALPRLEILRPLGEVLVEAAEREEQAVKSLRNDWHPFDAEVYRLFEQERNASGQLRRQVAAGLNQLLTQYNILSEDLGR